MRDLILRLFSKLNKYVSRYELEMKDYLFFRITLSLMKFYQRIIRM